MVSPRQIAVDLVVDLLGVSVGDVRIDHGGSRTVRTLAADRPPVQFLADAHQRLYGWLRAIKATPTSPFTVFIDPFHTQELGIHSYLLEQHFYTHQSLTSATKERLSKKELLVCV
jgi:hypothetical protein